MRDGCCTCFNTKWTLTINNLKCESYFWISNFFKGSGFWSAFSLCCYWDQIELESKVDEVASIVQVTFWRAGFHWKFCKTSRPGNHLFQKEKKNFGTFLPVSTLTIMYAIIWKYILSLFFILICWKLNHIDLLLLDRPRPSFCCSVIGQFYCESELSLKTQLQPIIAIRTKSFCFIKA